MRLPPIVQLGTLEWILNYMHEKISGTGSTRSETGFSPLVAFRICHEVPHSPLSTLSFLSLMIGQSHGQRIKMGVRYRHSHHTNSAVHAPWAYFLWTEFHLSGSWHWSMVLGNRSNFFPSFKSKTIGIMLHWIRSKTQQKSGIYLSYYWKRLERFGAICQNHQHAEMPIHLLTSQRQQHHRRSM